MTVKSHWMKDKMSFLSDKYLASYAQNTSISTAHVDFHVNCAILRVIIQNFNPNWNLVKFRNIKCHANSFLSSRVVIYGDPSIDIHEEVKRQVFFASFRC
jgi:hypothetical protein